MEQPEKFETDYLIIGSGPGGDAAANRLGQLGAFAPPGLNHFETSLRVVPSFTSSLLENPFTNKGRSNIILPIL